MIGLTLLSKKNCPEFQPFFVHTLVPRLSAVSGEASHLFGVY